MVRRITAEEANGEEKLLTVHEVAGVLRVDDTTVRRWIKNGAIEAIALPHAHERVPYRIKKSTLNNILKTGQLPEATAASAD